jgi:hypothetical protein
MSNKVMNTERSLTVSVRRDLLRYGQYCGSSTSLKNAQPPPRRVRDPRRVQNHMPAVKKATALRQYTNIQIAPPGSRPAGTAAASQPVTSTAAMKASTCDIPSHCDLHEQYCSAVVASCQMCRISATSTNSVSMLRTLLLVSLTLRMAASHAL